MNARKKAPGTKKAAPKKPAPAAEALSFEDALARLESIVERLEEGEIPLEESIQAYAEGTRLVRQCQEKLDAAETLIRELSESAEGFRLEASSVSAGGGEDEDDDDDETMRMARTRMTGSARFPSEAAAEAAEFGRYLDRTATRVDRALDRLLPPGRERPEVIHRAMRYTALSEGKRLRPAMVLLAYEACGGTGRKADPVAAALEMVHAFSLIHDDLPAMDDDDYRRGKPSNHKVFGEGTAILAGDALLAAAFGVLAGRAASRALGPEIAARLVAELAEATGSRGVIGGQVLDLVSEGKRVSRATVDRIHAGKTGRLFIAALRLGGTAAAAPPAVLNGLTAYGRDLGLAFQIVDDILNAAGTFRELGRDPGRDRVRGKVTYPGTVGFAASHRAVDRLLARARAGAGRLPAGQRRFRGLVEVVDRRRRDAAGALLVPGESA